MDGVDASSADGAGWGGGPVVVRARERRTHGEGASKSAVRRLEGSEGAGEYRRTGDGPVSGRATGTIDHPYC